MVSAHASDNKLGSDTRLHVNNEATPRNARIKGEGKRDVTRNIYRDI